LRARIDSNNTSIFLEMFQLRLPDLAREAPGIKIMGE